MTSKRTCVTLGVLIIGLVICEAAVKPQLVSTMDGALMIAPDGSLWAWGGTHRSDATWFGDRKVSEIPQQVGTDHDWYKVAAGFMTALAIKQDHSLWTWGWQYSGSGKSVGGFRFVAKPTKLDSGGSWAEIAVGAGHCLAIKSDGSLWGWGQNNDGQVGNGATNNQAIPTRIGIDQDWKNVTAGAFSSFALKNGGTVWGWGEGQSSTARRADNGSFQQQDQHRPRQLDPGTNWSAIAAGDFFLLALRADGTLWIGGQNLHSVTSDVSGQSPGRTLLRVGEGTGWASIYAGDSSFFARKKDGRWFACGHNYCDQLGVGKQGKVEALERLFLDTDCSSFATGAGNSVLLARNGTLLTWGKRLGSDQSSTAVTIKEDLNTIIERLSKRLPLFDTSAFKIDSTPVLLWNVSGL